ECFRRALEIRPGWAAAHSNLLFTMHFCPQFDALTLYQEHRSWNERHALPLRPLIQRHPNNQDANRRLRVGYISPDFRQHSVGRFLLPLLENHDRSQFEITCFSDVAITDAFTEQIRAAADQWHHVVGLTDEQLAQLVQHQEIDILVDLTMHTGQN